MKNSVVYGIWAGIYCLCVVLGFVPSPEGIGKYLLMATGVVCFLPPAYLGWKAKKEQDIKIFRVLFYVSTVILVLSTLLIALNFLSVYFSTTAGLVLNILLILFSAPMACCQYWVMGLFLWSCVFVVSLQGLRDLKYPGRR